MFFCFSQQKNGNFSCDLVHCIGVLFGSVDSLWFKMIFRYNKGITWYSIAMKKIEKLFNVSWTEISFLRCRYLIKIFGFEFYCEPFKFQVHASVWYINVICFMCYCISPAVFISLSLQVDTWSKVLMAAYRITRKLNQLTWTEKSFNASGATAGIVTAK